MRRILLLFILISGVCSRQDLPGQTYQGRQLVQAEAIARSATAAAGQPFLVGVRLHMAPGWHTYWKYPGDAGIPTEIQWQLPSGWKAGPIQWPIPLKLNEPGDIQIYGYHDDVLLIQELTPPADWKGGAVGFSAKVSWLVCEKICIPGDATVQLKAASPDEAALFTHFQEQLPKPAPAGLKTSWQKDANGLLLEVKGPDLAKAASVEFFPAPAENVAVPHPRLEARDGSRVVFRIPTTEKAFSSVPGLLVASSETHERRAWELAAPPPQAESSRSTFVASAPSRGLLGYLVLGFIGGFILNLMPCVLPVISLKIFGFVQQAGQDRRRILRSGLAFVAGIFAWFLGLALALVALKAAGHQITWAAQFTNPYFVLILSALVLAFALNLFGVFEISPPQWLNRGATEMSGTHGDAGSFFQGLFATVLGTSCTAPILGYAVGFALAQSSVIILLMFLAVAAGMALPYFLLSAQPAWLKFLPKPGSWMERVKQLMGFPMLATLVFLLYTLGAQRGSLAIVWTCAFLVTLSVACWLKGAFLTPLASAAQKSVVLVVMLALVLGGWLYFINGKFAEAKLEAAATSTTEGWEKFTPERLSQALEADHPTFIDFTAAWCITCKFNESTVLETDAVRSAFTERKVVKLRADWTNGDPAITKVLQQFGRPGVPLYVLYPGSGAQPVVFPELLTKNAVLQKLETLSHAVAYQ